MSSPCFPSRSNKTQYLSKYVVVLLKPVEVILESGMKQLYVDGGVVVNYPLHVFDGMCNQQVTSGMEQ